MEHGWPRHDAPAGVTTGREERAASDHQLCLPVTEVPGISPSILPFGFRQAWGSTAFNRVLLQCPVGEEASLCSKENSNIGAALPGQQACSRGAGCLAGKVVTK